MQSYVLGIDIGTGSTKAVAVNIAGEVIGTTQYHYTTLHPEAGSNEQNPEVVWSAFTRCIQQIFADTQQQPSAICLSSAMHGLIPVNKKGNALHNMITWADTRSADIAEEIKSSHEAEEIYKTTGTPIHAMSPLCKIIWMQRNNPSLFVKTNKFIGIKEYIWFKLFGTFQIDHSLASATGLFDIEKKKWSEKALALAHISEEQLSTPVPTNYTRNDVQSELAKELNISPNTTFIIGASDGCLANLGSFATASGTAALTIGTSGAVRIPSPKPIVDFSSMLFNYILDDDLFICGGPVNNGGNTVQWALSNFLNKTSPATTDYEALFKQIQTTPPGSSGLLFLPYINGERAPVWDAKSCGVFFGITSKHTQSHFLRAIVEGLCYALNDVLQKVEQLSSRIVQINASGGFIHSEVWLQILADITGKKICVIQQEDASATGAAYFALKKLNMITDYASLNKTTPRYIEPDAQHHQAYVQYFSLFKKIYQQLKDVMHSAHDIEFKVHSSKS